MYKGFPLAKATGYFAREFDKIAPAPGMDWTDAAYLWLDSAAQKGWVVKKSFMDAKPGALIVGLDRSRNDLVGIVREVRDGKISYETLDEAGKVVRHEIAAETPGRDIIFAGYIWPERAGDGKP